MAFPPMGSRLAASSLDTVSRCAFFLDFEACDETVDGYLRAESGHLGVFSRGATLASVLDSSGATYTAVDAQVAYESRLDASGRMRLGWRAGTSDRLVFADPLPLGAFSGYLDFVETGGVIGAAGGTLFAICNDAVSGARFWIDTSGTASGYYGANWHDGTTPRTARLAVRPTANQRVTLGFALSALGVVSVWQSINEAAETTAAAAALALPSAWGTGAVLRLNARGDTENPGMACYHAAKLVHAAPDRATLLAIR